MTEGRPDAPGKRRRMRAGARLREPRAAAIGVGVLGMLLRIWVMASSRGTNDVMLWREFALVINKEGLLRLYETRKIFNHPPLPGYWAALALKIEQGIGVRFDVTLKLLPMMGDVLTMVLLYQIWPRRARRGALAVGLFAFALDSVLVTAYHGNTDSLCAALALCAATLLDRGRFIGAGLAVAGAINVKLIPVFLVPVLALQCRRWRDLSRFAASLAVGVIPFLPLLLRIGRTFYRNCITYNSGAALWGLWGILHFADQARNLNRFGTPLVHVFWSEGRYLVAAAALALAALGRWNRRLTVHQVAFCAIAAFLTLAPGFAVQYTVYAVPLLLAVRLGEGAVYAGAAGCFAGFIYLHYWTGGSPWTSKLTSSFPMAAVLIGYATWALLLRTAASVLLSARGSAHESLPVELPAGTPTSI